MVAPRRAVPLGWDDGDPPRLAQRGQHPRLGVVTPVGDQGGGGDLRQEGVRPGQVVRRPAGQVQAGRVTQRVHRGVPLRAQPAPAPPERLAVAPFFRAPALCWWARTIVASSMAYSSSASALSAANTRYHTPPTAQRRNRWRTDLASPNRSGRSAQGVPAR